MKRMILASETSNNSSRTRWQRDKSGEYWRDIKRYRRNYAHGRGTMDPSGAGFHGRIFDENDNLVYEYKTATGVMEYPQHVQSILDSVARDEGIF